jgi:hypothetical protein
MYETANPRLVSQSINPKMPGPAVLHDSTETRLQSVQLGPAVRADLARTEQRRSGEHWLDREANELVKPVLNIPKEVYLDKYSHAWYKLTALAKVTAKSYFVLKNLYIFYL